MMVRQGFDTTDWKIVRLLAKDGRMTAKAMSRKLGLAEATIRNRLYRLIRSGNIRVKGLINHDIFEDKLVAYVALEVKEVANLDQIGLEISKLTSVQSVSIVSGRYDYIVEILVSSNRGIINFLKEELSTIPGIGKTETFLILKSFDKWVGMG